MEIDAKRLRELSLAKLKSEEAEKELEEILFLAYEEAVKGNTCLNIAFPTHCDYITQSLKQRGFDLGINIGFANLQNPLERGLYIGWDGIESNGF